MLDHKFKKQYGQNFLMDKNILNKKARHCKFVSNACI